VGVLTQYQPFELNTYIGNGRPWDLDRNDGGVYVLPPYVSAEKGEWYKGTANAIYQNIGFISRFDPQYVAVLSGDHIYKMDYSRMLKAHKAANAAATIAVIEVPIKEASRFGIMNTDGQMNIVEFEEKPQNPKSNLASMGVYIFSWSILKKYLIADENDPQSDNDFGKNIIPKMLNDGNKMIAYKFDGYWKDVGTIQSLWEANMNLLSENPGYLLDDENWKIFSRNPAMPPHYLSISAKVKNCYITAGCEIEGEVQNSVLFEGVKVEKGAKVKNSVIFPCATIKKGAYVEKALVGTNAYISEGVVIGSDDKDAIDEFYNNKICSDGISLIGADVEILKGIKIVPNSMVTQNISPKSNLLINTDIFTA
jgi:glucose-1-phosphate adenylyltransferase